MALPALAIPLIGAAASIGGGYLAGRNKQGAKPSPVEKKKAALIDQLLNGLNGEGNYADLYNSDEAAFQKSYVEPAKARFQNQIAPQIQQQYIANGQQNGSGLEDQLLRAGVDMNQLLNEAYGEFQNQAMNRKQSSINSILSVGNGTAPQQSGGGLSDSIGGFLNSDSFTNLISSFNSNGSDTTSGGNSTFKTTAPSSVPNQTLRRGYES